MRARKNKEVTNLLLEGLPARLRKQIVAQCERVDLVLGDILCERNQPSEYIYYPLTGFISLVTTLPDHPPLEMGLIGNEGMLGITHILGVSLAPERAVVQGAGTALRIPAKQFREQLKRHTLLLKRLNNYLYVLLSQQSRSLVCVRFHQIEPRLCRWLLMTHDRAHSDHFYLTHQFLADMLGVRRSGITVAAGVLQEKGLIAYTRGDMSVLDRTGLEQMSCECYRNSIEDYRNTAR